MDTARGGHRTLLLTTKHLPEQEALPTGALPLLHMCTHTSTCTHVHTHNVQTYMDMPRHTHIWEYVHMYTCIHTSRRTCNMKMLTYTCVHVGAHVDTRSCTRTRAHTCTPAQRCAWTHTCSHTHNTHVHVHSCVCLHTLMHMLTHTCVHTHKDRHAHSHTQVHSLFKMANYCCFLKRIHPTMVRQGASSPGQGSSVDTPPLGQRWQHQGTACSRVCSTPGLAHPWHFQPRRHPQERGPRPELTHGSHFNTHGQSAGSKRTAAVPPRSADRKVPCGCPHSAPPGWAATFSPHAGNAQKPMFPGLWSQARPWNPVSWTRELGATGNGQGQAGQGQCVLDRLETGPYGPECILGTWQTAQGAHLRVSPAPALLRPVDACYLD